MAEPQTATTSHANTSLQDLPPTVLTHIASLLPEVGGADWRSLRCVSRALRCGIAAPAVVAGDAAAGGVPLARLGQLLEVYSAATELTFRRSGGGGGAEGDDDDVDAALVAALAQVGRPLSFVGCNTACASPPPPATPLPKLPAPRPPPPQPPPQPNQPASCPTARGAR